MAKRRTSDEAWMVFWASLLSPLYLGEVDAKETARFLRQLAGEEHLFPDGTRRKPSLSTLRRKWKKLRQGGPRALQRKTRSDRGTVRKGRRSLIERAIELKKDQARRSSVVINHILKVESKQEIPKSTLYRHLKQAGATRQKLGIVSQPVRGRWTRDRSNALWVGDFEDGPRVIAGDQVVKTHLSAFIDCHSRYVVAARYYLRENLDVLVDTLLQAWSEHGSSREIYVDNAKVYHSRALKLASMATGTRVRYRKVRDPAGGGLIESFFRTVQSQFEAEVRAHSTLTLEKLNQGFSAWLAIGYHQTIHSEIRETPRDRYERDRLPRRHVDLGEIAAYFHQRVQRTVHRVYCDVQLHGKFYRVDTRLRGDRIEVRYDPFERPLETVLLYDPKTDVYLGKGVLHDRPVDPQQVPAPAKPERPKFDYVEMLIDEHRQQLDREARGLDYLAAMSHADRRWPFTEFVQRLASRLGKSGGMSAFSGSELETLHRFYLRHSRLTAVLVDRAVEAAAAPTITDVLFQLQLLLEEERSE